VTNEHSTHCRACKERVRELLTAIYGECRRNYQFSWPSRPEEYANGAVGNFLEQIRAALGNFRGHRDFIKSVRMPPCDYFVPDPPFIVEFDESQHFSHARLATLLVYPTDIQLGFSLTRWRQLCREINAKDDQPFDRDERRAWYDTLRDLLPNVYGFKPTVRLYAGEYQWCNLSAASAPDIDMFRVLLGDRLLAQAAKHRSD
jgi:hypothetical protein